MKLDGLVDAEARRSIRHDLDTTLVVEAAAGTGKTTELVQRITHVVETGRGRVGTMIAVTFTEKAAGEMKLRLRTELDRALQQAREDALRARVRGALAELETARIGTIHALCAELLRAYPVEAGVDPAFRVADGELASRLLRSEFERWLDSVRQAPPPGVQRVLARARGAGAENGRDALWSAVQRLAETRDFDALYRYPAFDREPALRKLAAELTEVAELAGRASNPRDPLARGLSTLARGLNVSREASLDELEATLRTLARDRDAWQGPGRGERFGRELLRADVITRRDAARAELSTVMAQASAELSAHLSRELRVVVEHYEARKAREGVLDFFDLLLRTRALLRDARGVRRALANTTTHLFVDEFQDVGPVQSEILLYLASQDPDCDDAYAAELVPGKLFVVGDPKQSIYRFRRADIALYDRIKRHLVARGAKELVLNTSFRSLPALQSFVNATFAPYMSGDVSRGQAAYVPLAAFRAARPDQPALIALPAPSPYGLSGKITKTAVEASLPDAVGAFVSWLVHKSGYVVQEGDGQVPLAARHVCLLFRRFRNWDGDVTRAYVRALELRRVPHVLSGGRAFFAREEVQALLAVLSAIEWPDDPLAVYATLRGPFVGLSDDVLMQFRLHVGSLSPFVPVEEETLPGTLREVAQVLTLLRRLYLARNTQSIATTLSLFLSAMRAHAGIAIWPTGEQALGNVLRVCDLARAFEQRSGATSFRAFVQTLQARAEQGELADAPVVEESSDGVRLMTVHAAKGLEFPVVVLCDPGAPQRVEHPSRYIDPERRLWAQALCNAEPEELTEHREQVAAHDEAEYVRLAYVAATRARDMLVVPTTAEGPVDGWLVPFAPALHPPDERKRSPHTEHLFRLPEFGSDAVLSSPTNAPHDPERGVAPGVHAPASGEHLVVMWDPYALPSSDGALAGVSQEELLKADTEGRDRAGLEAYEAFRARRQELLTRAAQGSYVVRSVTRADEEIALDDAGTDVAALLAAHGVTLIDTGATRDASVKGARFGSLVHALFEHAPLDADDALLTKLTRVLGRSLGASEAECLHAGLRVRAAFNHPFWKRVEAQAARSQVFREAQLVHAVSATELSEGIADLVFIEPDGERERIVLVDFKTDHQLKSAAKYAAQLESYARSLRAARAAEVECVLLWV